MKHLLALLIALLVAAVWVTGCGASPPSVASPSEEATTASPSAADQGTVTPTWTPSPRNEGTAATPAGAHVGEHETVTPRAGQDTPETALPCGAEGVVQLAKEELAERLGLSASEISVVSVETVDWPDTSLGCPQPGMVYAQVITPGYRLALGATGQRYEYHTDQDETVALCDEKVHPPPGGPPATGTPAGSPRLPTPSMGEPLEPPYPANVESLIEKAKQDLGSRLGIESGEIGVVHVEMAEWPDTRLGCGEPGLARLPVAVPGYRVVLSARDWEYVYHTDKESGVVYCPKR